MADIIEIKTLSNDLLKKLSEIMGDAFQHYPVSLYFSHKKKDVKKAQAHFYRLIIKYAFHYGKIYCIDDYSAAVMLVPPEKGEMSTLDIITHTTPLWFIKLGFTFITRVLYVSTFMDKNQSRYADEHSWYLFAIGVKQEHQGKKLASILLNHVLDMLDTQKLSCYLETFKDINVSIYKRFGFELMNTEQIPKSPLTLYAMLRKPKPIKDH